MKWIDFELKIVEQYCTLFLAYFEQNIFPCQSVTRPQLSNCHIQSHLSGRGQPGSCQNRFWARASAEPCKLYRAGAAPLRGETGDSTCFFILPRRSELRLQTMVWLGPLWEQTGVCAQISSMKELQNININTFCSVNSIHGETLSLIYVIGD